MILLQYLGQEGHAEVETVFGLAEIGRAGGGINIDSKCTIVQNESISLQAASWPSLPGAPLPVSGGLGNKKYITT